jgi:alpha-tubulin suppressor-like RCC1 family protein
LRALIHYKQLLIVVILFSLAGCIGKSKIEVNLKNLKKATTTTTTEPLNITVSNVQVVNHQIIITGTNLTAVSNFKIKEGSNNATLQIESLTSTTIVANTLTNVTFAAGKVFDFVFSSAQAASTFTVNFSLCDSSLGGKGFNCLMAPTDKQVLSYDQATGKWRPRSVNGLAYQGTWSALPALPATGVLIPGDYYIVSVANGAYNIGDWIVLNDDGVTFEQIQNSTAVTTVFGRTGNIVATENDYQLDQMGDVDVTTTPAISGDVLLYDGAKWVPGVVSAGGGTVTSVSGTLPISVATGSSTPVVSISQANTTTNGYLSSTDWNTFNNKQAALPTGGTTLQYFRGDKTLATLNTSVVPENTNLYFTNARALGILLTGFDNTLTGQVAATDSMLQAFGRVQNQINSLGSGGGNYLVKNGADTISGTVSLTNVITATATGDVIVNSVPLTMTSAVNKTYADGKLDKTAGGVVAGVVSLDNDLKIKAGANYVTVKGNAATAADYNFVLPVNAGTAGYLLSTDGAGNTSWITAGGGGAPTGAATGDLSGNYPNPTITALDAAKIGGGAVSNTEYSYLDGVTSAIQAQLNAKESSITAGTTAQYLRGDKSWQTLDTSIVSENTNLYFTNTRSIASPLTGFATGANSTILATDTVLGAFQKTQGQIAAKEPLITAGTTAQYLKGDKSLGTFLTDVMNSLLTGVSFATNSAIVAGDNLLVALGKLQAQVTGQATTLGTKADLTNGTQTITALAVTGLSAPIAGSDAANKTYVDSQASPSNSIRIYQARVATTGNITLSGTQTIDGVAVIAGDRVLVKNQTTKSQNGMYVVAAGAWARATDLDTWTEAVGYHVQVSAGGTWDGMSFISRAESSGTLGTNSLDWGGSGETINSENTIQGYSALNLNTSGYQNIAIGSYSLANNLTGYRNTANGYNSLISNTSGNNNTANGYNALYANTIGTQNTAMGSRALTAMTSGSSNIGVGYNSGSAITSGSNNVVIGSNTGSTIATLSNYILISDGAGTERARVDSSGFLGINTTAPGSSLDVKGTLRLSGSTSGYVGFAPAAAAGSTTYTLPSADGSAGQILRTDGAGVLSWVTDSTGGGAFSGTASRAVATDGAGALTTVTTTSTELGYVNGVTSAIQTQLNGKQSTDTTLTSLAAFNTNGILVQTAADIFVGRSIAGTANRVAVINGDGVTGNPTVNIATTLLPSPAGGDVGKFLKATAADTSVWTALGLSDVTTALGFTPINKAGDSITTGTITLSGAAVLRSPDPIALTDVANKQYVDSYGQWTKSGSDIYRTTGNVGIGTASPEAQLHVAGSVKIADGNQQNGYQLTSDASGNATWQKPKVWGQVCNPGQYLMGYDNNGNKMCGSTLVGFSMSPQSGGGSHQCAIMTDSTVACWGYNASGQLGNNTIANQSIGTFVRKADGSKISSVTSLALSWLNSCAVTNGEIYCWGDNAYYQGGLGSTTDSWLATKVPGITDAVQVNSGVYHTCARLADGRVKCWGLNDNGQIGINTLVTQTTPAFVLDTTGTGHLTGVSDITLGSKHTCAIKNGGVFCWGDNAYGMIGDGTVVDKKIPTATIGMTVNVVDIAASLAYYNDGTTTTWRSNTCVVKADGTVWCWGRCGEKQCGYSATPASNLSSPVQVLLDNNKDGVSDGPLTGATEVSMGALMGCAIMSDSTARCWGTNLGGSLGDATAISRNFGVPVAGVGGTGTLTNIKGISITGQYNNGSNVSAIAILNDGNAVGWGSNNRGQIGDNSVTARPSPVGLVQP